MRFEFSAGVIVYAYRDGKRHYLALKRDDFLDIPKGHIEKGESAEQAAIRETKEEAGLDVKLDPYYKDEIEYWFMDGGEKIKKHVTLFLSEVPGEAVVRISHEHHGHEWFGYDTGKKVLKHRNQVDAFERANEYIDRLEKMRKLNNEYSQLPIKHKNWGLSGNFVPGDGPLNARVFFVGQAPGRNEDEQRKPFIGMAGKLLETLIHRAGLKRKDVYITSVVQFFPPENRLPTDEEAKHCLPYLKRQIEIIKPKLLVLLGNFAAQNVNGTGEVSKNHGTLVKSKEYGCYIFITLHPAAAVRIKSNVPVMEADFEKLKELVKDWK